MQKVNVTEKLNQISDYWNPRVAAELNGQQIRLVKISGEFEFHKHENEDEMFFVIAGSLRIDTENDSFELTEGEFIVVPKGVLHRPVAKEEVHLMIFVAGSGINTGNLRNDMTLDTLKRI